jgi:transcriptional regulator with XRE-family HTH domain
VADGDSPVVQRRRVAKELRQLRLAAGMTVQQVAEHLECSPGKISRIETASVGARVGDVRDLLTIYGIDGDARERLLALVRLSHRRTSWWHEYAGVLPPESMRFFGLEDGAAAIDEYSANLVPGLLQSDGYSRALIGTAQDSVTTVVDEKLTAELRAELRGKRQRLLTRDGAPTIRLVLNEAALAVRFGGPETMAEQLDLLAAVATQPNVTVRVLPLSTEAFAAAGGSFTVFRFADASADPPIVYNELRTSSHYRENPDEVAVYLADFEDVFAKALPVRKSREVLRQWAGTHRAADRLSS